MTIIGWIVVGLIAGALARLILPGKQGGGWIGAMLLGIVGAIVGGILFGLFGGKGVGMCSVTPGRGVPWASP